MTPAPPAERPTVILRDCREYDVARIRSIARDGLERLGLRPHGQTLLKPNVVASGPRFPHAYTRPELVEGVLGALRDRDEGELRTLQVGERSGITMPTRLAFGEGGYREMARRAGVDLVHFEEVTQVEIPLYHPSRLRDSLYTPKVVAEADFFVNCPKFKAHPWTTVTFSLKSYIGIQDDRHRLLDHHYQLDEKVADLQYVIQPQFIAIDAITAGEGRMLTPIPFDLGLVIMADNQVAVDAVCCRIIGLDPLSVDHIRLAYERGFGPVELSEITLDGDVSLADAQRRAKGFRVGRIRVEEYFKDTNIRAYGGTPPGPSKAEGGSDYCWGGCPGAFEEAIEILRIYDAAASDKIPRTHVVFGKWDQPLDVAPGEKVIFMGDCAEYRGPLGDAGVVSIDSLFRDRSGMSPLDARDQDIFVKIASVYRDMRVLRRGHFIHLTGCPVSVAEQVLALVRLGDLPNPYFDPELVPTFVSTYLSWRTRTLMQRVLGRPYNTPGPTRRGDARPRQNLPPAGADPALELRDVD
ncbi:hypothetical protein ENSA5_08440 [Enhygromyxa salina]|uniref:DUF362 domain-containing protein n=1 Tax=Enhygromyxa salina TaxID=215803 RepID=A0A2S9YGU7_9BACT|nr:DUF362 domain-containing protein [Enhygromyxa salina]PRQ04335.1 hypothetical protein ENSA5_08440 [Enhygromyxa salina]